MRSFQPDDSSRWWTRKGAVHEHIWELVRRIEADQTRRRSMLKEYHLLYLDAWKGRFNDQGSLTFNLVRSCIDTVCSKIAKNKPRVDVLTSGGQYKQKKKAKQLTKFLDGQFREMNAYEKAQLVFRDACVYDGGALRIYRDPDSERIKCERAMVHEILVDHREGYYGQPRQLFHRRVMHRDVLAHLYPKKKAQIQDAPIASPDWMLDPVNKSDALIDVVESWHLPSAEGAKDGRHCIVIDGATLVDEPYTHADFPFVFLRWQEPLTGFWMPGLAQELWGIQAALNTHLEMIEQAHDLGGNGVVFVPEGSEIDQSDLNNGHLNIVRYKETGGGPPQFAVAPTLNESIYRYTDTLKSWGYEMPGVSQTGARGQKPGGVESGAAIREVNDLESERFMLASQRYEAFFLKLAEWVIRLAREAYEDGVDMTIKSRDRRFLESIAWSDVDMDDDSYDLAMYPTSGLSQQPAGRIQQVVDLATNGIIPQERAAMLLDFPDLESENELQFAPRNLIEKILDEMVDGGEYVAPEPQMNLQLGVEMGLLKLQWAKVEGVDEEAQEKLRTWIADCQAALQPPPEAVPPPGPAPMVSGLPNAARPAPPDMDTMAATMPALPGIPQTAMPGDMLAGGPPLPAVA